MAFAESADVEARLGRDLTDGETDTADSVIETVQGLIVQVTGQLEADIDPVPAYYKALCVEKAVGAIANPTNVASHSEQLGQYQHSETFPRTSDSGVFLTDDEQRMVRQIANNAVSGSTRTKSLVHDVYVTGDEQ